MSDQRFPFPDREASMLILHQDPCFKKIHPEQVDTVFEKAWQTGELQAQSFLREWEKTDTLSMLRFLESRNVQIFTQDIDYVMGNVRYFCEFISQENKIYVYSKSIALWAESNGLSYETAQNLILAHEYFHYLEWHKIGRTSKQCLVPMIKLGPIALGKTGVAALSEIAANAFANTCYASGLMRDLPEDRSKEEIQCNI